MLDLFIICGEHSGDVLGAELLKALPENTTVAGIGGPRMRKAGLTDCPIRMEEFQVMGFIDVIKALPKLLRLYKKVKTEIKARKPKTVLFIDYPGFNLRCARRLKKEMPNLRICHYVCPSVWAWGKRRIKWINETIDTLYCLLPFEPKIFPKGKALFVGHPLGEKAPKAFPETRKNLTLFPGSRIKEIERNLPLQLKTAERVLQDYPTWTLKISCADEKLLPLIQSLAPSAEIIPPGQKEKLMLETGLSLATSGTVTLECALYNIPTIVTYAIRKFDCFLAKYLFQINLPHYALTNIVLNARCFPELYGPNFTEKKLEYHLRNLLSSQEKYNVCKSGCETLRKLLENHTASNTVAQDLT